MSGTSRPERYRSTVIAHVMVAGASDAIDFYGKAFGADELFRISHPDGRILHAEIAIEGSVIMLGDPETPFDDPTSVGTTTVGLHVYVDDVDTLFARAVDAGATPIQPVQDMFYGDRVGMLRDPFGHIWVLLTHQEDMAPDEIKRRGEAMLGHAST